jgi:hypothetical protein
MERRVAQCRTLARPQESGRTGHPEPTRGRSAVAVQEHANIKVSVTAPGRVGASRLVVECASCGERESRYVPKGTVSVAHTCGAGWQAEPQSPARLS